MFCFVGDTVLDPFNGTATTQVAAAACGRNSIGIEVDPVYYADGLERLRREIGGLLSRADICAGELAGASGLPVTAADFCVQELTRRGLRSMRSSTR